VEIVIGRRRTKITGWHVRGGWRRRGYIEVGLRCAIARDGRGENGGGWRRESGIAFSDS
jgi:hypothetical protein